MLQGDAIAIGKVVSPLMFEEFLHRTLTSQVSGCQYPRFSNVNPVDSFAYIFFNFFAQKPFSAL